MANQLNYKKSISNFIGQRPYRPSENDESKIATGNKTVLFGTTPWDNIELWIYDFSGAMVASTKLAVTDPALRLSTILDTSGAYEFLDLDMATIAQNKLFLPPGRYTMTANFFRDEVGSLDGEQLNIQEISSDRTEVRLNVLSPSDTIISDIFEFVVPSVPKLFAQGLVDEIFGGNLLNVSGESVTKDSIITLLNAFISDTYSRITNATLQAAYINLFTILNDRIYVQTVNNIVADVANRNVQLVDLIQYISDAIDTVITDYKISGELDPRFELI